MRARIGHPLARVGLALALPLLLAGGGARAQDPGAGAPPPAQRRPQAAAPEQASAAYWREQGRRAVARARALAPARGRARNVVIFLGDGMGLTTVTAARILEGQRRGEPGEENLLAFEELPHVCLTKTYNTDQQVPDSAGTITAILSGAKTRSGLIGVEGTVARGDAAGVEGHELPSLFEQAEDRGMVTGVVTTARLTHATPAAVYAHAPERGWEDDTLLPPEARAIDFPDIARQLVEFSHGDGIDVVLGGGRSSFLPEGAVDPEYPERRGRRRDGRDLVAEWRRRHPDGRVVWSADGLSALDPAGARQVLGLFESSHMQFESARSADRAGEPSLAQMTLAALELLSRGERGFVLLVEAGRIDHAHHSGNAHGALGDTIALSDAVRVARARVSPAETLVVVTSDHGHVLGMGGYATRGNPILGLVVENDERGRPRETPARDALGLPYTTLGYLNGPGYTGASDVLPEGPKRLTPSPTRQHGVTRGRPDLSQVDTTAPDYVQEAAVPLASETHSGEDVPVYAGGPGAELFHGVQEQSYVYHAVVEALGWNAPAPAR
jgi:alkaline phosphatase